MDHDLPSPPGLPKYPAGRLKKRLRLRSGEVKIATLHPHRHQWHPGPPGQHRRSRVEHPLPEPFPFREHHHHPTSPEVVHRPGQGARVEPLLALGIGGDLEPPERPVDEPQERVAGVHGEQGLGPPEPAGVGHEQGLKGPHVGDGEHTRGAGGVPHPLHPEQHRDPEPANAGIEEPDQPLDGPSNQYPSRPSQPLPARCPTLGHRSNSPRPVSCPAHWPRPTTAPAP